MTAAVYHTGALGDFITTVPSLLFWRSRHPAERLALLGRPAIASLASDAGIIDGFLDMGAARFLPLFREAFSAEAEALLSPFSSIILFAADDSPIVNCARRCGAIEVFQQPPFPNGRVHAVDHHLSLFAEATAVPPEFSIPRIVPSRPAIARSEAFLSGGIHPVALHPGSGSALKNWAPERFVALADRIRRHAPVLWIKGPAEAGLECPLEDHTAAEAPLPVLAALLSRCRAFVGNDSGVAHLAAAIGCPTVVIFGPSDPAVWAPRGKSVTILHHQATCAPCHPPGEAGAACGRPCLDSIRVNEVLDALRL
jgi:ADP-heptose:LPS heptosyltransferase